MSVNSDQPKQSFIHVLGNIIWILKYVFKYAQTLAWDKMIRIPITVALAYININLTRWILDSVENETFSSTALTIVSIFSFFIVTNCLMAVLSILIVPQKKINLCTGIRKELIQKVSRIDQLNFQKPSFFDIYTLALKEVDNRAVQVLESVATILSSLLSFYVVTGTTAGISSKFALFGILSAFLEYVLGIMRQKISYKRTIEMTPGDRKREYVGRITYQPEFTSDLKVYPQFQKLLISRYEQAALEVKSIVRKYAKKLLLIDQGQQISAIILKQMLSWVFIAWLLVNEKVSIAEATVLSASAITIPGTFTKYMDHLGRLYSHSLYIENLRKLFSYEEGIEKEDDRKTELGQPVNIVCKDMSFAYADDMPTVLSQVSFTINHGEKIAIVGYNGAGKTTLARLLIRLFDKRSGELLINGHPVDAYKVKSVRSRIAYLSQEYKIYGFTIAENILMRPVMGEKDVELVKSVLKIVGLYEKVSGFENGMNTFVSREFDENGAYFSGGELQKLALARICAGNYDCIILDESTSALDPVSEDEIIKMIFTIFRDKTIIMISHRLATIQYVEQVYFMAQGVIREQGTHSQLMALQGEYARFYAAQADKYEQTA